MYHAHCADSESFVRGGPSLKEEGSKYHYKRAINDPPGKRHFKWHFAGGPMMAQHGMLA